MYETLTLERAEGVATVTLDRPERLNALDESMSEELTDVFETLSGDDGVRAVVLTGAGDEAFCSGADMKEESTHSRDRFEEFLEAGHGEFFDAIAECPKPVLCAVHGWAVGAGCQIPLCCDIIYASETATFRLPQTSLGILPAYAGAVRLARFVGKGKAAEMALLGEPLNAEDAHRLGLVQKVLPDRESLLAHTTERARTLADLPPLSVQMTKESLQTGLDVPIDSAKLTDKYRFFGLVTTEDRRERHAAERRSRTSDDRTEE